MDKLSLTLTLRDEEYNVNVDIAEIWEIKGSYDFNAPSDIDYHGGSYLDYTCFPTAKTLSLLSGLTEKEVESMIEEEIWEAYYKEKDNA